MKIMMTKILTKETVMMMIEASETVAARQEEQLKK